MLCFLIEPTHLCVAWNRLVCWLSFCKRNKFPSMRSASIQRTTTTSNVLVGITLCNIYISIINHTYIIVSSCHMQLMLIANQLPWISWYHSLISSIFDNRKSNPEEPIKPWYKSSLFEPRKCIDAPIFSCVLARSIYSRHFLINSYKLSDFHS